MATKTTATATKTTANATKTTATATKTTANATKKEKIINVVELLETARDNISDGNPFKQALIADLNEIINKI